jgi:VWFA-related protein
MKRIIPWLLALTLGTPAVPLLAQAENPEGEGPAGGAIFTETVDVEVVNVDVYVTDRKGEPVVGLQPADFQILEDGRPVEITNFYAVHGGRPRTVAGDAAEIVAEPAAPAASEPAATPAPVIPPDQRLHLVIFVDNLNITPISRNRVLSDLREFVEEQLQPSDRVMVVSFGGSLEILQSFTDDPAELVETLDDLADDTSMMGAAAAVERRNILRDIQEANLPVQPSDDQRLGSFGLGGESLSIAISQARAIYASIESFAQRHQDQTFVTLSALTQLVSSMSGLPGRKAVVYVSEGLSLRPGEALFGAWQAKFASLRDIEPDQGSSADFQQISELTGTLGVTSAELNVTRAFRDLGRLASTNRVTFYGLRPAGIFHLSAEDGTWDLGALDTGGGGQAWSAGLASVDSYNRGGSMRELADATGGFAITNAGAFNVALDRLRRDFDSYYSLGYAPSRPRDDDRHRIEVRVSGRKVQVRHREGYRDKSPEERMNEHTLAALLYEEANNPLEVSIEMMPPQRDDAGHQRLPVMVKIPIGNLVLVPGEGQYEGRVTIHVGARDSEGRTSPIRSVLVPIRIPKDQLREVVGRMAGHRLMLEMRPQEHTVVVGVRDELAGVESTTLFQPPTTEEAKQEAES